MLFRSYILTKFQETSAALGRIYEVIDTPSEIDKGTLTLGANMSTNHSRVIGQNLLVL